MVQMNLFAGKEQKHRRREWICGYRVGRGGGMNWEIRFDINTLSSVQSVSRGQLFATPWTTALQASLSITNSWSLLKLMSTELVMPSNHLILCCPLHLLPSIFPSWVGVRGAKYPVPNADSATQFIKKRCRGYSTS